MRDDFTDKTKEILAKRVSFKCSNPICLKQTVGPNFNPNKVTMIGIAAHITAASPKGPRFNANLTPEERKDISNGIWLCATCASIIDKDEIRYPESLLVEWKIEAEEKALELLSQGSSAINEKKRPYVEAELAWTNTWKESPLIHEDTPGLAQGLPIQLNKAIFLYPVIYTYKIKIYNNSTSPIFNLRIYENPKIWGFRILDRLPKINNLPPYQDLQVKIEYRHFFEGTAKEADDFLDMVFIKEMNGYKYLIEYMDEKRDIHYTELTIKENQIDNVFLDEMPNEYKEK